jgi:hypothetical protein
MGLETGTYVNDLVNTNPPNSDQESQGAAHLRLIKSVLQNTFPTNASRAWPFPQVPATKTANFSIVQGDFNKTFLVDTTSGIITATLPTLAASDQGWICYFIKLNTGTSPLLIAPASGSITSGEVTGLSSTRRCIPGHKTEVVWSGTAWFATRVPRVPVGSIIDLGLAGSSLPVGYEWPNGQTLASASANYPDYFAQNGSSGVTFDLRDKTVFGGGNMGGLGDRGLITVAGGNWDGTSQGAGGNGAQNITIAQNQLPNVAPSFTGTQQTWNLNQSVTSSVADSLGGGGSAAQNSGNFTPTVTITPAGTISSINGNVTQQKLLNLPPGISLTKLLVVE